MKNPHLIFFLHFSFTSLPRSCLLRVFSPSNNNAYSYTYAASSLQFNFNSSWREIDVIQPNGANQGEMIQHFTTLRHIYTFLYNFLTYHNNITKKPPTSNENIVNVATEIVVRRKKRQHISGEKKNVPARHCLFVCCTSSTFFGWQSCNYVIVRHKYIPCRLLTVNGMEKRDISRSGNGLKIV